MPESDRPPCTVTQDPFCGIDDYEGAIVDSEPELDEALYEHTGYDQNNEQWCAYDAYVERNYYESSGSYGESDWVGHAEYPTREHPGQPIYVLICDSCGRLYYGTKQRFNCPHCGFVRNSETRKLYFTLWGAWGEAKVSSALEDARRAWGVGLREAAKRRQARREQEDE